MRFPCIWAACLVVAVSYACARAETDRDAYVEKILASGMSEIAGNRLVQVAYVLAGYHEYAYREESATGRWTQSTIAIVMSHETEADKARAEEMALRRESIMAVLKTLADCDRSQFVSTAEATRIQTAIEHGTLVAQLRARFGDDRSAIRRGLGYPPEEQLAQRDAEFDAVSASALSMGLDILTAARPRR